MKISKQGKALQAAFALLLALGYQNCSKLHYDSSPADRTEASQSPPPMAQAVCTSDEILTAQKSFVKVVKSTETEIATICVDSVNPTVDGNRPTTPQLYLRFMNTCGNRACVQKGFDSGRVVEMSTNGLDLECRTSHVPETVSDSCQQKLGSLPKPVEVFIWQDSKIAEICKVPIPQSTDDSTLAQWVYTCGKRACASQGYTAGRLIEYTGGNSSVECTRDDLLNNLTSQTFVHTLMTNIEAVASSCVDTVNPAVSDNYPSKGGSSATRFYNTCGRRYCIQQGYESGRVIEVSDQNVLALCSR